MIKKEIEIIASGEIHFEKLPPNKIQVVVYVARQTRSSYYQKIFSGGTRGVKVMCKIQNQTQFHNVPLED